MVEIPIVLLVVLAAVAIGYARGGSLTRLSVLELPGWPLIFLALGVQALGAFAGALDLPSPRVLYVTGLVLSALLITAFVLRNRHLRGMPLIAAGFLLNAIAVSANGAMPVSQWAAARVGVDLSPLTRGEDAKHEIATRRTALRPLTDVIPAPLPVRRGSNIVSVGDVVLAAGIGVLVTNAMIRPGVGRRSRQITASPGPATAAPPHAHAHVPTAPPPAHAPTRAQAPVQPAAPWFRGASRPDPRG
ncbi:MAG TPA: DUF5317 domain-containing protein [Mycobacteriales bacterium]|nr:DUF5317 domain-containing protein [Mycobacteriales bacterium]